MRRIDGQGRADLTRHSTPRAATSLCSCQYVLANGTTGERAAPGWGEPGALQKRLEGNLPPWGKRGRFPRELSFSLPLKKSALA